MGWRPGRGTFQIAQPLSVGVNAMLPCAAEMKPGCEPLPGRVVEQAGAETVRDVPPWW